MPTLFSPQVIQKALQEKPWVQRSRPGKARVVPRTLKDRRANRDHGKYTLRYTFDEDGLPVILDCRDERTGKACQGWYFTDNCYHGAALAKHLMERRHEKRAA